MQVLGGFFHLPNILSTALYLFAAKYAIFRVQRIKLWGTMTLEEHFIRGKIELKERGYLHPNTIAGIIKEHGGLAWSIAKRYTKNPLEYKECLSYMYEALPGAVEEHNPIAGKAATALTLVMCRLLYQRTHALNTCGTVRVPVRSKRFSGVSLDTDVLEMSAALHNMLEEANIDEDEYGNS